MSIWTFLLLFLVGCVHFEQAVTVREDGSMKVTYQYSVPQEYIPTLKASKKILEKNQGFKTTESFLRWPFNKELALKKFNTEHTTLKTYDTWEKKQRKHVKITFVTNNINDLEKNPVLPRLTISKKGSNPQTNQYQLKFTPVKPDTEENNSMGEDAKRSLIQLLKGLRLKLTLNTPGKIVNTSGELIDQNTAQWNYRVKENRENSWLWKTPRINAVFEAKEDLIADESDAES